MARFGGIGRVEDEALAAATEETLIQLISATNQRVVLDGYGLGGKGTSNTEAPGVVEIKRQLNAGTGAALTLVQKDESIADTLTTTAQQGFSSEPSIGDVLIGHTVHPQSGLDIRDSFSREIIMGGGNRLGLVATFANAVNAEAYVSFEE